MPRRPPPPSLEKSGGAVSHPRAVSYRRSAHLVFYWSGRQLLACNYATRRQVFARPIVCEILDFFETWRTVPDLLARKPRLRQDQLSELLTLLVEASLLQRDDVPVPEAEGAMAAWADWNPAAGFFHNCTKDVEYGDLRTIDRLSREKARAVPMPASVKQYPGAPSCPLPSTPADGEFVRTLLRRRTWRRFARRPIDVAAFSTLLGLTAGAQGWLRDRHGGLVPLKTSPSGGARHSIELYALVLNVEGLARGLYHYACDSHALQLLDATVPARAVERYLPTQRWFKGASALVFFAALFGRVQWRYTHARAYRTALIEAGHLCQTFCLTATALGLAPFSTMALADTRIEQDFGLDGVGESVLYAAGVGRAPAGVGWSPPDRIGTSVQRLSRRQATSFPGRIPRYRSGEE